MTAWLRAHPWQADTLLAAVLFLFSVGQFPTGPAKVVLASDRGHRAAGRHGDTAPPVPGGGVRGGGRDRRRADRLRHAVRRPGAASSRWSRECTDVAIPVLLYTLAAHRPRRVSIAGLAICLLGVAAAITRWSPAHGPDSGGAVFGAVAGLGGAALTAWVLGDSVAYRYRRAYYASLEERAARLEAERDAQARIAAAAERARELQERRARAVDESAARLRRIERDLHDGAQVRLAALALSLGEIKENLEAAAARADDDGHIAVLVGAAHENAKETLAELRDLARGIHPPVLDRGLGAALSTLAEASAIPVALSVSIAERPSPAIESIAYFCAAELLANVAKHSGASRATISAGDQGARILMTVTDDGAGGARLAPGGGLAGLLERVQTVDGRLEVDSPPGGPTIITIELPGHA